MIVGNIALGTFLGTAGTIGLLLGLPFDIRHIAFSSANLGVAIASSPELLNQNLLIWGLFGVFGIGFVNFIVSFCLTMLTTLRSRQVTFRQWRRLTLARAREFLRSPLRWFYPVGGDCKTTGAKADSC